MVSLFWCWRVAAGDGHLRAVPEVHHRHVPHRAAGRHGLDRGAQPWARHFDKVTGACKLEGPYESLVFLSCCSCFSPWLMRWRIRWGARSASRYTLSVDNNAPYLRCVLCCYYYKWFNSCWVLKGMLKFLVVTCQCSCIDTKIFVTNHLNIILTWNTWGKFQVFLPFTWCYSSLCAYVLNYLTIDFSIQDHM